MTKANLTELPHELWDQIVAHIPLARDLSHLGQADKSLHKYVENEGWAIFSRRQFPWVSPAPSSSWRSTARTLTTVSRAWDRRAYVIRTLEPTGLITTFPSGTKVEQWKRPSGQTMGFAPRIDVLDYDASATKATTILAFSAGAQICLAKQSARLVVGHKRSEHRTWSTYKPFSAREGIDDVTSLHLLAQAVDESHDQQEVIAGTANGDLQHLSIPFDSGTSSVKTYFTTQGLPVQATSLLQHGGHKPLLAAALGNDQLAVYTVDGAQGKIAPSSTISLRTTESTQPAFRAASCRVWTTALLAKEQVAIGIGVSETPLQLCTLTPSGFDSAGTRSFKLTDGSGKAVRSSSVFAVSPSHDNKQTFFSGAYDGVVRLHDLRAPGDVQTSFSMPNNDNAIYSLLTKGHQTLLAGTSRHDTIQVFDLRMKAGQYCYTDARLNSTGYSLFMPKVESRGRGTTEGSVYSLATGSSSSPMIYAGLQNTILEMAVTEIDHPHPDPLHFRPWPASKKSARPYDWNNWKERSIRNIARYEDAALITQTDMVTTWQNVHRKALRRDSGLDIRWWQS
ncbi:hypothetical protein AMS68_004665 [Peltaster fructicola]|uniref:F-box domain-containing protein n=1 Tax=Peltaster fructicola TaxID=286661 RepID=A0A6H0XX23_9PEZI|nr:hypothetical protein AMS68_004665 [Peltaster fructicola]